MENLSLDNYGELCSSQIYFFENDVKSNRNMIYFDFKNDYSINVSNNKVKITHDKKEYANYILKSIKNFDELISKNEVIEIYKYDNAKEKTKNKFKFTATSPDGKKDFDFYFEKEQAIIGFMKNKYFFHIVEYKDGTIGEKIADVWIDNNGFKWFDKDEFFVKSADMEIKCSKFLKSSNTNCIIMEHCPTHYEFKYIDEFFNKEYEIYYNDHRIPNKIIDIKSGKEIPIREEIIYINDNDKIINTIYPLLFDPFNYHYIDKPMDYWCSSTVTKSDNSFTIIRKIYKIDPLLLGKLINYDLIRDLDKCILDNNEF